MRTRNNAAIGATVQSLLGRPMQELALEAYTLMHLADTAFPTGGFAFSQGLESMGKSGHLKSEKDLDEYLLSQLKTVCEFELPFINSSYALYDDFDNNTLLSMTNEWEAFNTVESIRKASEILGENWFSLIKSAYKPNDIEELEQQFRSRSLPKYFQIVLPLLLRRIGFERTAIQRLVLYMALRDQFSAGIRLGLIGPLRAQALHVAIAPKCEALRLRFADTTYDRAVRSQPMIEMAQTGHQYMYSKLFQN